MRETIMFNCNNLLILKGIVLFLEGWSVTLMQGQIYVPGLMITLYKKGVHMGSPLHMFYLYCPSSP